MTKIVQHHIKRKEDNKIDSICGRGRGRIHALNILLNTIVSTDDGRIAIRTTHQLQTQARESETAAFLQVKPLVEDVVAPALGRVDDALRRMSCGARLDLVKRRLGQSVHWRTKGRRDMRVSQRTTWIPERGQGGNQQKCGVEHDCSGDKESFDSPSKFSFTLSALRLFGRMTTPR